MILTAASPAVRPRISTILRRDRSPTVIETARFGTPNASARTSISSAFAAPSTGGALSRTSNASSRTPASPARAARGTTRTAIRTPSCVGVSTPDLTALRLGVRDSPLACGLTVSRGIELRPSGTSLEFHLREFQRPQKEVYRTCLTIISHVRTTGGEFRVGDPIQLIHRLGQSLSGKTSPIRASGSTSRQARCFSSISVRGGTKRGTKIPCDPGGVCKLLKRLAPQAGFEPATLRLTAGCSAVELLRNMGGAARVEVLHVQHRTRHGTQSAAGGSISAGGQFDALPIAPVAPLKTLLNYRGWPGERGRTCHAEAGTTSPRDSPTRHPIMPSLHHPFTPSPLHHLTASLPPAR